MHMFGLLSYKSTLISNLQTKVCLTNNKNMCLYVSILKKKPDT